MPRVKLISPKGVRRLSLERISTLSSLSVTGESQSGSLKKLLFSYCPGCLKAGAMCSIPQGVFVAHQVRYQVDKCNATRADEKPNSSAEEFKFKAGDQPLLRYNSKLMNSIWGLYNRYSVHNFKKNNSDVMGASVEVQQCQLFNDTAVEPVSTDVSSSTSWGTNGSVTGVANNPPPFSASLGTCRSFVIKTLRNI